MKEAAVQCEFKKEAVENLKQDNRVHSRVYFLGKNMIICSVYLKLTDKYCALTMCYSQAMLETWFS